MRRFALIVLLSAFALFLGMDGREVASPAHAAVPGGNGKIAFNSGQQIVIVEADGTHPTILAAGTQPAWSPDGRRIAFKGVNPGGVSVMNADGGGRIDLTSDNDHAPEWSPDGGQIAYIRSMSGGVTAIWVMNEDGTHQRQLASMTPPDLISSLSLSWSPDGAKILFSGKVEGPPGGLNRLDLFTVSAAGGAITNLSNTPGIPPDTVNAESMPDWSPDGAKIVLQFSANTLIDSQLLSMDASGGGRQLLLPVVSNPLHYVYPSWSPDGQQIVYELQNGTSHEIRIVNSDGSGDHSIGVAGSDPDWQPVPVPKVEFTQAIQVLQSIDKLKDDLAGDGQPPVPLVAGKPAVMRVLFDKVDTATTYTVEVSGEFNGSEIVTLTPACDIDQRRKQDAGCTSVDFYFTPPEGNWSVTLSVKDSGGAVVEYHEFNLTSEETDDLVIKAVSVCDSRAPGFLGVWQCQDATPVIGLASLMRRMLPTSSLSVQLTGAQVRELASSFARPIDWWGQVDRDLQAMYGITDALAVLAGQETYYFGLTRTTIPGGTLGAAYTNTRGAASTASYPGLGFEAIPWVVAHEMGHAMGRDHTNTAAPALSGGRGCWLGTSTQVPPWPYADNMLRSGAAPGVVEVGFDVASKTALPGDKYFEMMGYCAAPPPSAATPDIVSWISPFTTTQLLEPSGPLRLPAQPATASGDFWFVRGTMDHESGAAALEPLMKFELEGPVEPGSGTHRIEVQGAGGAPLFTRFFTPAHGHGSPSPGNPVLDTEDAFNELIPVQAGAARIAVFDEENTEIGAITLVGTAPAVTITQAANDGDVVSVTWSVQDADSTEHTYWVDYSPDDGTTWANLAMGLADAGLALDADMLAGSSNAVVRVIASDGVNSGEAVSAPFTVAGKLPHGEIIGPSGGSFREGSLVWLQAAAWDVDDGMLDGGDVTWSSSRDGNLGTGASLPVYDLSVGTHTITMTAKDSDDNAVTDSITVTVFDGPIVEGQAVLSGDVDCSGAVNAVDALKLSRQVAGLPVTQTQPCPVIGTGNPSAFGDVNCDGNITAVDTLFVLRFVAGMPVNLPQGCRPVGT